MLLSHRARTLKLKNCLTLRNKKKKMVSNKQEFAREKIKRFDDIFRMLLLIVTILLSVGVGKVNLIFILVPLFWWMVGHAVGHKYEDLEVECKLYALLFTSFIVIVMLIKSALGLSELSSLLRVASFFFSFTLTTMASQLFKEMLDDELWFARKKRLWYVAINFGVLVFYASYI
jgi:hypothetical protein